MTPALLIAAIVAGTLGLTALLVFLQGLWVKRVTPRLAEAEGPRMGVVGSQGSQQGNEGGQVQLKVLVTGESPAAGVGVDHQDQALAAQIAAHLDRDHGIASHWCVAARSGVRLADLEGLLADVPGRFDAVVIVTGVNDAKAFEGAAPFRRRAEALRAWLAERHPDALQLWCGVPPLDRFPALPRPLSDLLGWRSRVLDRQLHALCAGRDTCLHRPVIVDGDGDFARDGFHPGPHGSARWGSAVADLIVSERSIEHAATTREPRDLTEVPA